MGAGGFGGCLKHFLLFIFVFTHGNGCKNFPLIAPALANLIPTKNYPELSIFEFFEQGQDLSAFVVSCGERL